MTGVLSRLGRAFTRKELQYLHALKKRNAELFSEKHGHKLWSRGLTNPMTARERKLRQRIRRKAIQMIFDLVLVGEAGVLPDRKLRKQGVKSIGGMVDDVQNYMILQMVGENLAKGG